MSKDTFYFSHDYNARQNKKLRRVIQKHGMQGYGLFWSIIEDLYQNENILKYDLDSLEYDYRCDGNIIKSVIEDFNLFQIEDGNFGSIAIQERIDERNIKSKKYSDNAYKRWGKNESRNKADKCIFYIIKIFKDSEVFLKCGITTESISRRYSGKLNGYEYSTIYQKEGSVDDCLSLEKLIAANFKTYTPENSFAGYLECYNIEDEVQIVNTAMQRECKGNAIKERKGNKVNKENNITYYRAFNHLSMTFDECDKLKSLGYSVNQIDNILDAIENNKNNKNYVSLFLTAKNWLSKETPAIKPIQPKTVSLTMYPSYIIYCHHCRENKVEPQPESEFNKANGIN